MQSEKGVANAGMLDAQIHNLETFGCLLHLLNPDRTNPRILENDFAFFV